MNYRCDGWYDQHRQERGPKQSVKRDISGVYAGDQLLEKLEQAGRLPSKEKFRRMVCSTFVATGACPYNDRCKSDIAHLMTFFSSLVVG